ncbi:acyl-CoA desaturase [soil metagenome]
MFNSRVFSPFKAVIHWFDTTRPEANVDGGDQDKKIDWARCAPFFAMHFACLLVFWVGWSWVAVAVCAAMYAIRMFAITGIYHRYFSHRTYKTSRVTQFLFGVLGNSAVQRGPLWWAAHHRHHHRHSDDEHDVHSPHTHGLLWSHMFWITSRTNFITRMNEVKDLAKFPELKFLDRYDVVVPVVLGFLMFGLGAGLNYFFPGLGTSGSQMLIWGFFISTVVLFHGTCTINSLSHLMGNTRYETGDKSKNSLILALVTFGEGWHNNHHFYPATARQGFFWWEIDITYYVLRTMSFFGLIWDLKGVPDHVRAKTIAAAQQNAAIEEDAAA